MKNFFISILLLGFMITANSEEGGNPDIKIELIQFSRILPHAYCDQGKDSVESAFPDSEMITFQRFAYLSDRPYCLMAYKEDKKTDDITITGVFLVDMKAFRFETKTLEQSLGNSLLYVAEQISRYQITN